ncbi:MAG: ABC transporter ATP-binding protein [Tissierellia bacterium]|nr:ABC transporter ATP-binding protein [Tissierellia bacterium]
MFLEVSNITKKYGDRFAIKDISFSLEKGKLLSVLGASGSGKTTILRAIGGFINLNLGKIILDGEDITNLPAEKRQVATVFQSYALFPHMSVKDNIGYGLKFRNFSKLEKNEMIKEMIDTVGLSGQEHKRPHELSGGERQRVALARSLVIKPKLLLLDEPLSNLDKNLREVLREEISSIQKQFEITAIFVTHDQEEAFSISDTVMLLNQGELIRVDSPVEMYNNLEDNYSKDFIGNLNEKDGLYSRFESIIDDAEGEEVEVVDVKFLGERIIYTLKDKDNDLINMVELNNGFIRKVGEKIKVKIEWKEAK